MLYEMFQHLQSLEPFTQEWAEYKQALEIQLKLVDAMLNISPEREAKEANK